MLLSQVVKSRSLCSCKFCDRMFMINTTLVIRIDSMPRYQDTFNMKRAITRLFLCMFLLSSLFGTDSLRLFDALLAIR